MAQTSAMIDPSGRAITYLRLSVTDRCDLRCTYCMPAHMRFLPRAEMLTLDELDRLASAFIAKGVRTLRLTGGEPLVRRDLMQLVEALSRHLRGGALEELTLTTNASRLAQFADTLARHGVRRVNVSLDSLDPDTYRRITRGGDLARTLAGIEAARAAGLAVKLNVVALKQDNLAETVRLAEWAHRQQMAITFIEVMPLGDVGAERIDQHVPLTQVRALLAARWTLTDSVARTGGPARYVRTDEGGTIGFITPLSHNFCGSCNRVRVTCTGRLFACLGHDSGVDLRTPLRESADDTLLFSAIDRAIGAKPERHDFRIAAGAGAATTRHMSMTGG